VLEKFKCREKLVGQTYDRAVVTAEILSFVVQEDLMMIVPEVTKFIQLVLTILATSV